ncbi:MAG TPA: hypothetical protein PJ984_02960 [Candidatus Saccharibacteria bacterium]|nr:hypothetical protein [Patescibacteria group bacterium]HMS31329.1 hypothetical protein [Candidatus Saccharibacteria bacterium]
MGKNLEVPAEVSSTLRKIKVAQSVGETASQLEKRAVDLRRTLGDLDIQPLDAPDGFTFVVTVLNREGVLTIEPFDHKSRDWGDPYRPGDPEYEAMVKRSPIGDDAAIKVGSLEFDTHRAQTWGFNALRRVRVLIDHNVRVKLVESE